MKFLRTKSEIGGDGLINLDKVIAVVKDVNGKAEFNLQEDGICSSDIDYLELIFILKSNGLIIEEENGD